MIEIFKVKTGIAPDLMKDVFNLLIYLMREQGKCPWHNNY